MIRAEMPDDITQVEAKIGGYFTKRQLICLVIAVILALFFRSLFPKDKYTDVKNFITLLAVVGPMSFAVIKPYGMHLEQFLLSAFTDNVLAPKNRTYQIENSWEDEYNKILEEEREIIAEYDRIYNIKKPKAVINDPNDRPRIKRNLLNPELTGYL